MSFQDFGRNNSRRAPANAALRNGPRPTPIPEATSSSSGTTSMGQISESLTQYQRNVGILEKIAQQLLATPGNHHSRKELEQQYQVQLDVLRQLEDRVKKQMLLQRTTLAKNTNPLTASNTQNQKQALVKLERDFERVQSTANACKARITRQQKQLQQRGGAAAVAVATDAQNNQNQAANHLQQEQKQFQMQLEQDRLNEEIMREREQEIFNINKGMHTVNEIYKDLAHIVGSQQEQVDVIETQMEDAKTNAESGLSQVQKANEKYNQSNCIIS